MVSRHLKRSLITLIPKTRKEHQSWCIKWYECVPVVVKTHFHVNIACLKVKSNERERERGVIGALLEGPLGMLTGQHKGGGVQEAALPESQQQMPYDSGLPPLDAPSVHHTFPYRPYSVAESYA